jgi:hypothetical protein
MTALEQIHELYEKYGDPHAGTAYRGNSQLVPDNFNTFIPQELHLLYIREIIRCRTDPIYFANNYYYIVSPAKGKHIIKTYPKQEDMVKCFIDDNRVVALAARQTGKTTSYCIFAAWFVCFNEDKKILILANKMATAMDIMSRIRLAFEMLPKWLKPRVKEWNKSRIELVNGCTIEGCATSSDAARGKSANCLIIDEAAFIPNNIMSELWSSVYPIISSDPKGSKCILVSTPNGTGNLYYETYQQALDQVQDDVGEKWTPFRFDWWEVPGRDDRWKEQQLNSFHGDQKKFDQEFGNEFLSSSYTLIKAQFIMAQRKMILPTIKDLNFHDFDVHVWVAPQPNRIYVVGCDVSDGSGLDSTVIEVFDISDPLNEGITQVAEFGSPHVGAAEAAYIACKLGTMYNFAPLMIERNNMGHTTVTLAHSVYDYDNIVSYGSRALGIHSSNKHKVDACLNMKMYLNSGKIKIKLNSPQLLKEMEYFIRKDTGTTFTYSAPGGKHDDYVMATVWALYILKEEILDMMFEAEYHQVDMNLFPSRITTFDSFLAVDRDQELSALERAWNMMNKGEDGEPIRKPRPEDDWGTDDEYDGAEFGFFSL